MARKVKTPEERIAEINAEIEAHKTRISSHQNKIAALEEKIEKIRSGSTRKASIEQIIRKANSSGMAVEEISEKLGLQL